MCISCSVLSEFEMEAAKGHSFAENGYCACGEQNPKANFVAETGGKGYSTLAEAIANANGGTVKLVKSVVTEAMSIEANVTIDLNGERIYFKATAEKSAVLTIASGYEVMITNGTLCTTGNNSYTTVIENNGNLTITDVIVRGTGLGGENTATLRNNGTVSINGVSFVLAIDWNGVAIENKGDCTVNLTATPTADARVQGVIKTVENGLTIDGKHGAIETISIN